MTDITAETVRERLSVDDLLAAMGNLAFGADAGLRPTERAADAAGNSPLRMAVIVDEYGSLEGIATPTDILEVIAGDFPDEDEEQLVAEKVEDGFWLVDGWIDIRKASNLLDVDLVDETDRYSTLAGYILWRLGHLPQAGETVATGNLAFEVISMKERNIDKVRVRHVAETAAVS